jgi:hypothetical protein
MEIDLVESLLPRSESFGFIILEKEDVINGIRLR